MSVLYCHSTGGATSFCSCL